MHMKNQNRISTKGLTLIELLVALVICGVVIGGIYRVFIAQSKAHTVQEQVVEVQQGIRSAMEILLRDLRMAGYDNDSLTSNISIVNPVVVDPVNGDQKVTVNYEYDDTHRHEVMYYLDNGNLRRQLTIWPDVGASTSTNDVILEHVEGLNFTYGVDTNSDGSLDSWVSAGAIGINKVMAVRVALTASPDQTNPDVKNWVSPRTLTSAVTIRNLCFKR